MAEIVWGVATADLPAWVKDKEASRALVTLDLSDIKTQWLSRNAAETDTAFRQIIPYLLVLDREGCLAVYRRSGSEDRLHGLYSCGVGGHVNFQDQGKDPFETMQNGARRELAEEFSDLDTGGYTLESLGWISETRTPVGRVHLGAVHLVRINGLNRPEAGMELTGLEWLTPEEAVDRNLELWSRLALELLSIK